MLSDWKGAVDIDGKSYSSINAIEHRISVGNTFHIQLHSASPKRAENHVAMSENDTLYRIQVKAYMTKRATPEFDFMAKFNNDVPMPMRIMFGKKIKETKGMVYMELYCDMYANVMYTCMRCGRPLTNKVSQFFGIGPECGNHNYVNPFDTEEELKQAVESYRKQLREKTWSGWVIKSAIIEEEKIDG